VQQPSRPVQTAPTPMEGSPLTTLTSREREIAALIAEGLTNAEIARRLVITTGTAANDVAHIMRAIKARNRARVAVWAVEHGLRRSVG
jgi:DNA-binding NarL/FixJ family response regulator